MNNKLPEGPTNNPEYNYLLQKWGRQGYSSIPECEECGKDLTCQDVIECTGWFCTDCAEAYENSDQGPSDWECRQSERRQMGIGG